MLRKTKKENYTSSTFAHQLVIRKTGKDINRNYRNNLFEYYLIETNNPLKWKIYPEIKILGDYHLQKTETDFGGRHWIAWFAKEIPIQEVPYKFNGLPGMILEISDSRNHYSYKLMSNHKLAKDLIPLNFWKRIMEKPIKITNDKLHEIKLNYYNDP